MVFTMVSTMEEWLHEQHRDTKASAGKSMPRQEDRARYEDATLTLRGGAVTASSFAEWLKRFNAEQASPRAAAGCKSEADGQKVTGRQLFERNRALATSDVIFGDDEGLVFEDEEIYEGLDDLRLEGEEELVDQAQSQDSADAASAAS